uniref:Uncharacterized protein n=1 Tax=viral metagenome TaxID=1070528 RepID=A0A6C0HD80_9ZZZZ
MLFWTLQITIISIILIFLVHNLIGFFKSTLTVPKVKDLVNAPAQKYENMLSVLSNSSSISSDSNAYLPELIELSTKPNVSSMKNELKSFLKNKLKGASQENTTSIASLDLGSGSNSLSYSEL